MKLYEHLAVTLRNHGVTALYGLVGDGNLFFVDHFARGLGGTYVAAVHEANAVMMAAGHASVTGGVGVATVTHGPGLTNVLTAVVEGVKSSTPMVVIVGDTSTVSGYHPQDIDQQPIVEATGAGFVRVRTPATVGTDVAQAFRRARVERRPVVLNVPIDYMWFEVDPPREPEPSVDPHPGSVPAEEQLDRALGILATARRPIVLAGQGALHARGHLVALARALGAPLATTLQAKDLFFGATADLGIFGNLATSAAQDIIAASDCLVAFGASLNPYTTDDGRMLQGKAVVHCDVAGAAIGRYHRFDAAVLADAGPTAQAMVRLLEEVDHAPSSFNGEHTVARLAQLPGAFDATTDGSLDLRAALAHLDTVLPPRRNVVVDVGRFALHALQVMHAPDATSWSGSGAGFSAIGLGMGMAVGAGVARRDRPTVLVVGDGGFMLGGLNEFTTAVTQKLDLICIVCNDSSYGAEHIQFTQRDMDPGLSLFEWPDLAVLADHLGGRGFAVSTNADLGALSEVIASRDRPLLIELRCDPTRVAVNE